MCIRDRDRNVTFKKRLFITATPRVYSNVGNDDEQVLSMDNEKWYGEEIYKYTVRNGIRDKQLSDYQIVTMLVTDDYVKKFVDDNKLVKVYDTEDMPAHYVISAIMVYKAFFEGMCNHLLTYHNTIKNSKIFMELLKNV